MRDFSDGFNSTFVRTSRSEQGQALLVVVLIMVVAITIGLSVALKSITSVRISVDQENSERAFSAAEAGIEKVLKTSSDIASEFTLDNNTKIKSARLTRSADSEFILNNGTIVEKDEGTDVWFVNHTDTGDVQYAPVWNGKLTVFWGSSSSSCTSAAVEIVLLYGASSDTAQAKRFAIDPCNTRSANNKFLAPTASAATVAGQTFYYSYTIDPISSGILARVVPLYFSTPVAVRGQTATGQPQALGTQGKRIESTGIAGGTERKITYFQGYPKVPAELFQYVLFSAR